MRYTSFESDPRIGVVLDLVSALSRAEAPADVLWQFSHHWAKLDGPRGYISLSCRGLEPGAYRVTRRLSSDEFLKMSEVDTWSGGRDPGPVHRGGLLGRIVSRRAPVLITDLDVAGDPVLGDALEPYAGLLAVPLFERGEVMHWSIELWLDPRELSGQDIEEMLLRSNLVGGTVRHVQTAAELREQQDRSRSEIQRIAQIQRALLPARTPEIQGVTVETSYQTFDQAGGDMYFFHPIGTDPLSQVGDHDGRWSVLVADVSGHGPAAAVVMAMIEAMLASLPGDRTVLPHGILEHLNRHLCLKRIEASFVTAVAGIFDPERRTFRYARAGHPPPLWRHHDPGRRPAVDALDAVGGLPLGVFEDERYEDTAVTMEPGDTLLLYTDGITETRAPSGRFFGVEGVRGVLGECSGEAGCVVETVNRRLREHEAGGRPQDDQTLVVVHLEPELARRRGASGRAEAAGV